MLPCVLGLVQWQGIAELEFQNVVFMNVLYLPVMQLKFQQKCLFVNSTAILALNNTPAYSREVSLGQCHFEFMAVLLHVINVNIPMTLYGLQK